MALTGGSRGAVSWGLRYLLEQALIESLPRGAAHPAYLRYRAKAEADEAASVR